MEQDEDAQPEFIEENGVWKAYINWGEGQQLYISMEPIGNNQYRLYNYTNFYMRPYAIVKDGITTWINPSLNERFEYEVNESVATSSNMTVYVNAENITTRQTIYTIRSYKGATETGLDAENFTSEYSNINISLRQSGNAVEVRGQVNEGISDFNAYVFYDEEIELPEIYNN